MANLKKLFVYVPKDTTFDGASVSAASAEKIFFEEGTQTIWNKGTAYGISKTLADKITANEGNIAKLVDLIGASEKAETAQSILTRLAAVETATSKPISVADDDDILTLTPGESSTSLTATLGLNYDETSKKIQLTGKSDAVIADIDATLFIKDGMLDSAELVVDPEGKAAGTYIKLTFNTDGGKDPIFINVTSLIDTYTSGNAQTLTVSGYTITPVTSAIAEGATGLAIAGDVYTAIAATAHTHDNKTVLDGITAEKVIGWDDAAAKAHEHANLEELDKVAEGDVAKWNAASAKAHEHANKDVLDTVTADVVSNSHKHDNKTVLDGITAEKVADWNDAADKAHEHAGTGASSADDAYIVVTVNEEKGDVSGVTVEFSPWETYSA